MNSVANTEDREEVLIDVHLWRPRSEISATTERKGAWSWARNRQVQVKLGYGQRPEDCKRR
jgi:hypothetical protein